MNTVKKDQSLVVASKPGISIDINIKNTELNGLSKDISGRSALSR